MISEACGSRTCTATGHKHEGNKSKFTSHQNEFQTFPVKMNKLVENTFIFPGFYQRNFGRLGRLTGGHRSPVRPWGQAPLSAGTPVPGPALLTPSGNRTPTAPSRVVHVLVIAVFFMLRRRVGLRTTHRDLNFPLPPNGLRTKQGYKEADWFLYMYFQFLRERKITFFSGAIQIKLIMNQREKMHNYGKLLLRNNSKIGCVFWSPDKTDLVKNHTWNSGPN